MIGLVGIEVDIEQKKVYVKIARQWPRSMINQIPEEISKIYQKVQWGITYIDQQTGQHFIQDLRKNKHIPMKHIETYNK